MTRLTLTLLVVLAIAACSSTPTLEPRRGGNPEQVDLSGDWVLRSDDAPEVSHEKTIRVPEAVSRRRVNQQRRQSTGRSTGPSAHLFLESGKVLDITQTDYGLFFSFDRAIVEEYNFGEHRDVAIGPIEARRVSGWEGRQFIIDTMDKQGNVLTERWELDGETLVREITVSKGENVLMSRRQVFDRS